MCVIDWSCVWIAIASTCTSSTNYFICNAVVYVPASASKTVEKLKHLFFLTNRVARDLYLVGIRCLSSYGDESSGPGLPKVEVGTSLWVVNH